MICHSELFEFLECPQRFPVRNAITAGVTVRFAGLSYRTDKIEVTISLSARNYFRVLRLTVFLKRSLTVSCKNSTNVCFFFGVATCISSHLWLQRGQRNSGFPPLRRSTCTHALHMISLQWVHLNFATASACRGQTISPPAKTTGGLGLGRSYSGIVTLASVDSTNSSRSPSVTVWPDNRRLSLT